MPSIATYFYKNLKIMGIVNITYDIFKVCLLVGTICPFLFNILLKTISIVIKLCCIYKVYVSNKYLDTCE